MESISIPVSDRQRWVIVGSGNMARRMAQAVAVRHDAELVAVVSESESRARALASDGEVQWIRSVHDLDSVVADVCYIASTSNRHALDSTVCLRRGFHVLCEKPLGATPVEVESTIASARQANRFLMEAMWSRFLPAWGALHDTVVSGVLGKPKIVTSSLGYLVDPDPQRRWFNPELGGGALLDLAIYGLDLAVELLGEPANVSTSVTRIGQVDSQAVATAVHRQGALSVTTVSFETPLPGEAIIAGSLGTARLGPEFQHARTMEVSTSNSNEVIDTSFSHSGLDPEIDEVHRCIAAGTIESPTMTHNESRRLHRVLYMARAGVSLTASVSSSSLADAAQSEASSGSPLPLAHDSPDQ